jgi:hypothetical protein
MKRQSSVYAVLIAIIIFVFLGMSLINGWIQDQIVDIKSEEKGIISEVPSPAPATFKNKDLELIGTPNDPLAPVRNIRTEESSIHQKDVTDKNKASFLPPEKSSALLQ